MTASVNRRNAFNRWRATMREVFDNSRIVRVLFMATLGNCCIAMGWYPPGPDAFPLNDNERRA